MSNDEYIKDLISISKRTSELMKAVAETQRQSLKETKRNDYKRTEAKKLVKEMGSVGDLAEKKEALNKLINSTPANNNRRKEMLEEYRQVDTKIKDYWDKKITSWEEGTAKVDDEFKKPVIKVDKDIKK
jgi:hypothetical protein